MTGKLKQLTLLILFTTAPAFLFSGCYGNFPLTKAIYRFNGSIGKQSEMSGRFINSIVMIAFLIIPVYGIGTFADAIIFNLIEFWTGHPVNIGMNSSSTAQKDGKLSLSQSQDGEILTIHVRENGEMKSYYAFRSRPGELFVRKNNQYVSVRLSGSKVDANSMEIRSTEGKSVKVSLDAFDRMTQRVQTAMANSGISPADRTAALPAAGHAGSF